MTGFPISLTDPTSRDLLFFLHSYKFKFGSELELQDAIEDALQEHGFSYRREASLSASDRPDFMVGPVAIEVKTDGAVMPLLRQLQRYATHLEVRELLVVTSRFQLTQLPSAILKKRVRVLYVGWSAL